MDRIEKSPPKKTGIVVTLRLLQVTIGHISA
ncbi:hypothetical protein DALLNEIH_01371 [Bacillus sp. B01(2024)]